ncbi:MAG: anhydro-N-acetylmuramic acid kinase [Pseudomonadota bacterium]
MTTNSPTWYIGLLSGTSADGIDAALVRFTDTGPLSEVTLSMPYPEQIAAELQLLLSDPAATRIDTLARLDSQLGDVFADAVLALLRTANIAATDVVAIGSHGQTLWHAPNDAAPNTVQIGDPNRIAARTGITVVADLRRADLAVGGHGAPLAPLLHDGLFRDTTRTRVVANLGGIANISILQPGRPVRGFDTGPANVLMDLWAQRCEIGSHDHNGAMAASGRVCHALLEQMRSEPYFGEAAPKSTGRELFNSNWLDQHLHRFGYAGDALSDQAAQIMATLAELTATTVIDAVTSSVGDDLPNTDLVLCGGGAHNDYLRARLATLITPGRLMTTDDLGVDSDFLEATLFAWLAAQRIDGTLVDTRAITGATRTVQLGAVYRPPHEA